MQHPHIGAGSGDIAREDPQQPPHAWAGGLAGVEHGDRGRVVAVHSDMAVPPADRGDGYLDGGRCLQLVDMDGAAADVVRPGAVGVDAHGGAEPAVARGGGRVCVDDAAVPSGPRWHHRSAVESREGIADEPQVA